MRRDSTSLWCCLLVLGAASPVLSQTLPAFEPPLPDTAITTTIPTLPVEEVVVEAPEPRYVASTRRDRIGRVWAPVLINGKGPFRLVLDTGATGSAVIGSVADKLGTALNSKLVRLHGVTGSAMVPTITVDRMEVGDLLLEGKRLPVVADAFGGAEGVLGTDGLIDKRIFIDFGRDRISIMRSRNERPASDFSQVPFTLSRNRLVTLDVLLGTIRVKAILDTGAQLTIGNQALREQLKGRRNAEMRTQEVVGVTLDVATGEIVAVPTMHIGSIDVRNLHLTFGDMFIFQHWKLTREPAVLIGMDVIGTLDVLVIDYKKQELQMRTRR